MLFIKHCLNVNVQQWLCIALDNTNDAGLSSHRVGENFLIKTSLNDAPMRKESF